MENVLATTSTTKLDRSKPLVKEFFDRNAEITSYLKLRLPHLPHFAHMTIIYLYTKKDGKTHKYRANWYGQDSFIGMSQYVEVITTKEGRPTSHSVI